VGLISDQIGIRRVRHKAATEEKEKCIRTRQVYKDNARVKTRLLFYGNWMSPTTISLTYGFV
jgi:hypothetical protein